MTPTFHAYPSDANPVVYTVYPEPPAGSGGNLLNTSLRNLADGLSSVSSLSSLSSNVSALSTNLTALTNDVSALSDALSGKVSATDSRLNDRRSPTSHGSTHAAGGDDAITISTSQVTGLDGILANYLPLTGGNITGTLSVGGSAVINGYDIDGRFSDVEASISGNAEAVGAQFKMLSDDLEAAFNQHNQNQAAQFDAMAGAIDAAISGVNSAISGRAGGGRLDYLFLGGFGGGESGCVEICNVYGYTGVLIGGDTGLLLYNASGSLTGGFYVSGAIRLGNYTGVSSAHEGMLAWDYTNHVLKVHNGTTWRTVSTT